MSRTSSPNSNSSLNALATLDLGSGFQISAVDGKFRQRTGLQAPSPTPKAALGVLANFTGQFAGTGFNMIFRPNSGPPTTTIFPAPVSPPPPNPPSENVLELNLTTETLTFSSPLGSVPNRGLEKQNDILLNGVSYCGYPFFSMGAGVAGMDHSACGSAAPEPGGR